MENKNQYKLSIDSFSDTVSIIDFPLSYSSLAYFFLGFVFYCWYNVSMVPDVVIRKDRKPLLLLDAKYKDEILEHDLYQVWVYCIVYSLPKGVLVYPKHATISDEIRTLRTAKVNSIVRHIDLNKHTLQEFEQECTRFSREIEFLMND